MTEMQTCEMEVLCNKLICHILLFHHAFYFTESHIPTIALLYTIILV